jgi:pimeloyl-ACP methyl ester carboxylesterase
VLLTAMVCDGIFRRPKGIGATELTYADVDPARYPRRPIRFRSGRRVLQGYLYPSGPAKGVVVVAGGLFSGADRHLGEIVRFVDGGWRVFAFDGTGIGQSEGRSARGLPQTRLDLLAALDALHRDPVVGGDPIVVYGHSVGGYAALTALAQTSCIRAAVSVAGFDRPLEVMRYHARQHAGRWAAGSTPLLRAHLRLRFGGAADRSAREAVIGSNVPVMLIEGSADRVVPPFLGVGPVTRPGVRYRLIDAPERNTHSTLWLSGEAAALTLTGRDQQRDAWPRERRLAANRPDPAFMKEVLTFFDGAV